jgi:hypothetical protein
MYFLIETHLNKINYNLNFILLIGLFLISKHGEGSTDRKYTVKFYFF